MVHAPGNHAPPEKREHREGQDRRRFCVQTKARCEDFATLNLENKYITVFSPKIEGVIVRSFKNVKRVVPLFPNYIFARINPVFEHDKVRWTPGVKQILSDSHGPLHVEDEIIAGIVAGLKKAYWKGEKLKTGDIVAVNRGAFSGLSGTFQQYTAGQARVKVLLDLIYRQVVVAEFDRACVKKI